MLREKDRQFHVPPTWPVSVDRRSWLSLFVSLKESSGFNATAEQLTN